MKRNSKVALKSVPKHQNGIVLAHVNQLSGNKTYSSAAATASKINKSLVNGSGLMAASTDNDALPLVMPDKQNGPAGDNNSNLAEGTASVDSRMVNGVLDLRKRNGISFGIGQDGKPAKQQTAAENQANYVEGERWIQQSVLTGFGDSVIHSGLTVAERKPEQLIVNCAPPVKNNEPKRMATDDKRLATDSLQKQTMHELKPVKILQRPASVAKCQTPEKNPGLDPYSYGSPHPRKPREKCLSLNTEEREHLENLIENLIISCVDNEDDSSGEETGADLAPRMIKPAVVHRPTMNMGQGKVPGKLEGQTVQTSSSASKTEREARSEIPKGMASRNEASVKGRKFVKETSGSRNTGRGKDQGKRRENSKAKDNRKTSDFQLTRSNEETRQVTQQDNLQDRQDMMSADVYPAQLKVAIKHMDALPPRFLRRIQNGKSSISGSEPALSALNDDRSDTPTPPEEDLKASYSTGKDLDKSKQNKKQGVKNMIRSLLNNMDDDESAAQRPETCARKLNFSLGAIGEHRETKATDSSVRDAFLSGGPQSSDTNLDNTQALFSNGFDPFQTRTALFGQKQLEEGFPTKRSGTAASQGLNTNPDFRSHTTYPVEWSNAYDGFMATASPLPAPKKASFSVNAPEFVSKLYEQCPAVSSDTMENDANANLSWYGYMNAKNDVANQFSSQQHPVVSNMPGARNLGQPEYFGSSGNLRYSQLSNMPATARDMVSTYSNPDGFSNELIPGHGPTNTDPLQLIRLMQYNNGGYLHPHQQMQMLQQLSQQQLQLSQQQLQQLSQQQQQQLLSQQQMLPPSHLNQAFVGGGMRAPVTGNPNQVPWFPGNQGVYMAAVPSKNAQPLQPLPFEIGRQMLMKLMNEGRRVMVILVGRVDDNKLSLISELQTNVSGTLVLNLRNGMSPNSDEKEMELHRWNYKQALDATQMLKNPIIIDHTYAQPWQMKDYIGLAQMNKYLVQIIDCDETRQYREAVPSAGSYVHDDQVPRFQSAVEVMPLDKENGTTVVDLSRCNIPGVENNACSNYSSQLSSSPMLPTSSLSNELDVAQGGIVPVLKS